MTKNILHEICLRTHMIQPTSHQSQLIAPFMTDFLITLKLRKELYYFMKNGIKLYRTIFFPSTFKKE